MLSSWGRRAFTLSFIATGIWFKCCMCQASPDSVLKAFPCAQAPFGVDDGKCFRQLYVSFQRIYEFRNLNGMKQPNFLKSLLQTYGASERERLPLGSVLT